MSESKMVNILPDLYGSKRKQQNSKRERPTKLYTTAEWDAIKPHFIRLYITEEKRLKDVQHILEHEHHFPATVKMLKTHITRWRIGKHRSAREVNHGIKIFRRAERAGRKVSMTIKGKPTTLEDLQKHLTKKGVNEESVESPTSSTPSSVEYYEYEEEEVEDEEEHLDPDEEEEEEPESDDDDKSNNALFAARSALPHSDLNGEANASLAFGIRNSTASMHYDRNEPSDADVYPETLVRRLRLLDDSTSGEPSESSQIPEDFKERLSERLQRFLAETLPHTSSQFSKYSSKCPGLDVLQAYDEAREQGNEAEAILQYQKGRRIMKDMMAVPNELSIVCICELMHKALVSKNAEMPKMMLKCVTQLGKSPLTSIVSSVMYANSGGDGPSPIQLLGFVYEEAMEIIRTDFSDSVVSEVLKKRYAIFCSPAE